MAVRQDARPCASAMGYRPGRATPHNYHRRDGAMTVLIPHEALAAKGISYSKPHLWRLEQFHREVEAGKKEKTSAPLFPLRVHLGPSKYGYIETEIDAYVA